MERVEEINKKIDDMLMKLTMANSENDKERQKILVRAFVMKIQSEINNKNILSLFKDELDIKLSAGAYRNKCGVDVSKCMKIIEELDTILSNGDEIIAQARKKAMKRAQSVIKIADRIYNKSVKLVNYINRFASTIPLKKVVENNVEIEPQSKPELNDDANKSQHPESSKDDSDSSSTIKEEISESENNSMETEIESTTINNDKSETDDIKSNQLEIESNDSEELEESEQIPNEDNSKLKNIKKASFEAPQSKIIDHDDKIIIEMELPNGFDADDLKFEIDENNLDSFGILGFNKPVRFSIDSDLVDVTRSVYKISTIPGSRWLQPKRVLRISIPRRRSMRNIYQPTRRVPYHYPQHSSPFLTHGPFGGLF